MKTLICDNCHNATQMSDAIQINTMLCVCEDCFTEEMENTYPHAFSLKFCSDNSITSNVITIWSK